MKISPKTLKDFLNFVGFPVLAAGALGWFILHQKEEYKLEKREYRKEFKEERAESRNAFVGLQDKTTNAFIREQSLNRESNEKLAKSLRSLEMTIQSQKNTQAQR